MDKTQSKRLISYELKNASGNIWSIAFGLVFPIFFGVVIYKGSLSQIPESFAKEFGTALFLSMIIMSINSILLIGYATNLSLELVDKVTLRLNLFGISQKAIVVSKLIAQMILFVICVLIYTFFYYILVGIAKPALTGLLIYILSISVLSIITFVLGHGLANLFQKFGPTYAVTMMFMLGTMFVSGMMGLQLEQLPKFLKNLTYILPYVYISQDFYKVWMGESYNFVPFIQSMIFLASFSLLVLLFSFYYRRRK